MNQIQSGGGPIMARCHCSSLTNFYDLGVLTSSVQTQIRMMQNDQQSFPGFQLVNVSIWTKPVLSLGNYEIMHNATIVYTVLEHEEKPKEPRDIDTTILDMYFNSDMSVDDIARELGIHWMGVRAIINHYNSFPEEKGEKLNGTHSK